MHGTILIRAGRTRLRYAVGGGLLTGVVALAVAASPAAMAAPALPAVTLVPCSVGALDAAIASASAGAVLSLLPGCRYRLNAPLRSPAVSLSIRGNGDTIARSSAPGTPSFTILIVKVGLSIGLDGVTIRNGGGVAGGGAIFSNGTLTVTNSAFIGNTGGPGGGAINNDDGNLDVSGSSFTDNQADFGAGYGGAIWSTGTGTVTVTDSIFTGNQAHLGGAISISGLLLLDHDLVAYNNASVTGGGIYRASGTVTLVHTAVVHNHPNNCAPLGSVPGCFG